MSDRDMDALAVASFFRITLFSIGVFQIIC